MVAKVGDGAVPALAGEADPAAELCLVERSLPKAVLGVLADNFLRRPAEAAQLCLPGAVNVLISMPGVLQPRGLNPATLPVLPATGLDGPVPTGRRTPPRRPGR
ncbi:hypothetical protein [Streptomyces sp. CAU 1734]|uniref:hypothetical protein n=1 Tax=Streptomyces sp. CAU 1734 TaxID=3140360 RepID=UPI003260554E